MSNDTIPSMTGALADLAARLLAAKEGGTAEPVEINRDGHPVDVSVIMTFIIVCLKWYRLKEWFGPGEISKI